MKKRYIVKLTGEEREHLEDLIHRGRHAADRRRRAQILLLVDEGELGPALPDSEAAQTMNVSRRNVEMVRERCVMEGLEQAVDRKKRVRERSRKLDGKGEAQLAQMACSEAPEGQARWTLRLLADRLVELEVVESISRECVRQSLKKELKPWKRDMWCIPKLCDAAFVCQMEQVLDVYEQPYHPEYPLICMDETIKQCTREVRARIAAKPGQTEKYDGEYERNGVRHLVLFYAPLESWRRVQIADNHNAVEWAEGVRRLVKEDFPATKCITLVMDNLSTHTSASLYKAFEPKHAHRLMKKLNVVYTPKHGSWLNMAECEFSVLARQCLDRRISDMESLKSEVGAWEARRNENAKPADWRFATGLQTPIPNLIQTYRRS